jgi:hypothetical protein
MRQQRHGSHVGEWADLVGAELPETLGDDRTDEDGRPT